MRERTSTKEGLLFRFMSSRLWRKKLGLGLYMQDMALFMFYLKTCCYSS